MRSSSDLSLRKDRPVAAPVIVRTLEMRLLAGIALRTVAQYFAVHPRPADQVAQLFLEKHLCCNLGLRLQAFVLVT